MGKVSLIPDFGTNEHAAQITQGRHPGVQAAMAWLTFAHLPEALQPYSRTFYMNGVLLLENIPTDSPELTTALNRLVDAKDSAVRAGIRHDQGKPGSVPRPEVVVDPPFEWPVQDNRETRP
jgi:hypothetical protein